MAAPQPEAAPSPRAGGSASVPGMPKDSMARFRFQLEADGLPNVTAALASPSGLQKLRAQQVEAGEEFSDVDSEGLSQPGELLRHSLRSDAGAPDAGQHVKPRAAPWRAVAGAEEVDEEASSNTAATTPLPLHRDDALQEQLIWPSPYTSFGDRWQAQLRFQGTPRPSLQCQGFFAWPRRSFSAPQAKTPPPGTPMSAFRRTEPSPEPEVPAMPAAKEPSLEPEPPAMIMAEEPSPEPEVPAMPAAKEPSLEPEPPAMIMARTPPPGTPMSAFRRTEPSPEPEVPAMPAAKEPSLEPEPPAMIMARTPPPGTPMSAFRRTEPSLEPETPAITRAEEQSSEPETPAKATPQELPPDAETPVTAQLEEALLEATSPETLPHPKQEVEALAEATLAEVLPHLKTRTVDTKAHAVVEQRRRSRQAKGSPLVQIPIESLCDEVPPSGRKRPARSCVRPLAHWRNEQQVFERLPGSQVPTVAAVVLNPVEERAPAPQATPPKRNRGSAARSPVNGKRSGRKVLEPARAQAAERRSSKRQRSPSCSRTPRAALDFSGAPAKTVTKRGRTDRSLSSQPQESHRRTVESTSTSSQGHPDDFIELPAADSSSLPCGIRVSLDRPGWTCCDIRVPPRSFSTAERLTTAKAMVMHVMGAPQEDGLKASIDGEVICLHKGDSFTVRSGSEYYLENASVEGYAHVKMVLLTE
eukprot:TRINITY_DN5755_c0_g1_i1.p1 TRINITY_DN5755_c0_g1~~TRINITY_DN5755_c0_g1_i1.p1  ORF type:complete len:698 (+),score=135.76 TRINITY_DN5755_c0_g1_i1:22-2115(+)